MLYRIRFACYVDEVGIDQIDAWRAAQTGDVRAAFDDAVLALQETPPKWWRRHRYAKLASDSCLGLAEVRFFVGKNPKIHYRVLGFLNPQDANEFLLLHAFKKNDDPDYELSCPEAQKRRNAIEDDPSRAHECNFPP
jgi:hypothetical protein